MSTDLQHEQANSPNFFQKELELSKKTNSAPEAGNREKQDNSPNKIDSPSAPRASNDDGSPSKNDEKVYPTGMKLAFILISLCSTTFLVALDSTIIATAIPTITNQFKSLDDVAWYNSSYLLLTCCFQLPYGRAYKLLNTKWTYISSIVIFEIGSLVCATAPSSIALIIGRAIQGLAGAGIFGGSFIIIAQCTPLKNRSIFAGSLGATFVIASIIGPILGGAFTTKLTWRWCFYINLPIGGIAFLIATYFLPRALDKEWTASSDLHNRTWWQILVKFDPIGTVVLLPSITCLILALQWGENEAWSSPRIIATLAVFAVLIVVWGALQVYQGDDATLPGSVVCQRSVLSATIYTLCGSASFTVIVYYLPIWFQAIKQENAEQSGIHVIALSISLIISALSAGGFVAAVGYYTPFLIIGAILTSIGSGLFMTLQPSSSIGSWLGYQIIFGLGIGMSIEQCNIAVQTVLPEDKVPAGISLNVFARSLGGTISLAIAQNVFEQKLRKNISGALPNFDSSVISESGATNLVSNVRNATGGNQAEVQEVIQLYNNAVVRVFLVSLILAVISFIAALPVEWKSVKKEKKERKKDELNEKA